MLYLQDKKNPNPLGQSQTQPQPKTTGIKIINMGLAGDGPTWLELTGPSNGSDDDDDWLPRGEGLGASI